MSLLAPYILHGAGGGGGSYTEQLVTVPQLRHLDIDTTSRISGVTQVLIFFSGTVTGDNDDREMVITFGDAFSHLMLSDPAAVSGVDGVFYRMRSNYGANLIEQPLTLLNTRVHVICSTVIDDTGNTIESKAAYKLGAGSWTTITTATETDTTGSTLQDVANTTASWRIFGAIANTDRGFEGDAARLAVWVGTATDGSHIADPSSATTQGWFESGGITVDPATSQSNLSSFTRYIDLYGDASNYEDPPVNDGTLSLTYGGSSGTFTNA